MKKTVVQTYDNTKEAVVNTSDKVVKTTKEQKEKFTSFISNKWDSFTDKNQTTKETK